MLKSKELRFFGVKTGTSSRYESTLEAERIKGILAHDLRGEEIMKAVEKALAE